MLQEEEQMLVNMKKILEIAEAEGYAIPCINTPNEETVRAVIGAAEELNTPIIIDPVSYTHLDVYKRQVQTRNRVTYPCPG